MTYIIGIDPGPIAGVVWLQLWDAPARQVRKVQAMQITSGALINVLDAIRLTVFESDAVAYERFVVGPRAARSGTPHAGATTRGMIGEVEAWAHLHCAAYARTAAEVKPWATDERLDAAGLLEPTKGMRHARDAARHALYTAVKVYGLPDPLSRKGRAA
jgi:hypothetical protein